MILLPLWFACAPVAYRRTDLQLEVAAPLPAEAATLHLCVSATGNWDVGAGNGRAVFTGIRADQPVTVTVDVLDERGDVIGRATADFDTSTTRVLAPFEEAKLARCSESGSRAPASAATWVLGIRFAEASWASRPTATHPSAG